VPPQNPVDRTLVDVSTLGVNLAVKADHHTDEILPASDES